MKRPLLLPLVPLYSAALALREVRMQRGWEKTRRLRNPVVSIGNLSTGGSGKTPLTIALAKMLSAKGFNVDVLSRGYGRRTSEALRVDPDGSADDFGDEPLLIAREAGIPVFVAPERYDAGQLAEADNCRPDPADKNHPEASDSAKRPRVHILDDGFQHRQLARDIDILLMDRDDWHDSLLPAGNLREPVQAGRRADVLAIPANDTAFESDLRAWGWTGPIWRLHRSMQIPQIDGSVIAFCGIAHPRQFFAGLEASGLHVADRIAFPDHHRYTPADIERLNSSARHNGATAILTTEKDRLRMGKLLPISPLHCAGLHTEIRDQSAVLDWLKARLGAHVANAPL